MNRKVKSFVINRKEWARGGKAGGSALLLKSGQRCCLGIYGKRLGISDEMMFCTSAPDSDHDTTDAYKESHQADWLFRGGLGGRSRDCGDLMTVNDTRTICEDEREAEIKRLFAKNGIKVSFRG